MVGVAASRLKMAYFWPKNGHFSDRPRVAKKAKKGLLPKGVTFWGLFWPFWAKNGPKWPKIEIISILASFLRRDLVAGALFKNVHVFDMFW